MPYTFAAFQFRFQFHFMTLTVDIIDRHDPSNEIGRYPTENNVHVHVACVHVPCKFHQLV